MAGPGGGGGGGKQAFAGSPHQSRPRVRIHHFKIVRFLQTWGFIFHFYIGYGSAMHWGEYTYSHI